MTPRGKMVLNGPSYKGAYKRPFFAYAMAGHLGLRVGRVTVVIARKSLGMGHSEVGGTFVLRAWLLLLLLEKQ
jgi:hypothetical protein